MSTLRIPAFLELTPVEWPAAPLARREGRTARHGRAGTAPPVAAIRPSVPFERMGAAAPAVVPAATAPTSVAPVSAAPVSAAHASAAPESAAPESASPGSAMPAIAATAIGAAPAVPASSASPRDPTGAAADAAPEAAPAVDATPILQLRPLPGGRLAFALLSKVGAALVTGESVAPCDDPQAFGRRVLEACTAPEAPALVESPQGPRLAFGAAARGLQAHSRPAIDAAHARALARLIAIQAAGASIRVDAA